jgi:glycosyltransferase involved in cell wall biosynthesis
LLNFDKFAEVDDYYLVVSRLEPYKNVDKVIEVFNLLGLKLKIVGLGSEKVGLKLMASKNIEFLEGINNQALEKLYKHAKGLILSAEEEDFGITTIEASSVGTPVIALRSGGFIETVVEGRNGMFYDENTVESLLEAVKIFNEKKFDREIVRNVVKDKYTKQIFKTNILNIVNSLTH